MQELGQMLVSARTDDLRTEINAVREQQDRMSDRTEMPGDARARCDAAQHQMVDRLL